MEQFQHHPDDLIIIISESKKYMATLLDFNKDLGAVYEFEKKERLYQPGIMHFVDSVPQSLTWLEGDKYINDIDVLLAAQAKRTKPVEIKITKGNAIIKLNYMAEKIRGKFVINLPGQIGAYTQKKEEYNQWIKNEDDTETLYPIANFERLAYNPILSINEIMTIWGQQITQWAKITAEIEYVKRKGLNDLELNDIDFKVVLSTAQNKFNIIGELT